MIDVRKFFREANQMRVGGRLYYSIEERNFRMLEAYQDKSPALRQALEEASRMDRNPGSLVLVSVDLIKDAEEDLLG